MSIWYHPVRFVLFCPQNLDETARKATRYTSFSDSGTLTHKIFYRIVREKFLELPVKLSGQRFIVGDHQRGPIQRLDDVRHGKCLSRSGHAQKGLELITLLKTVHQVRDRRGLIAGGGVLGM